MIMFDHEELWPSACLQSKSQNSKVCEEATCMSNDASTFDFIKIRWELWGHLQYTARKGKLANHRVQGFQVTAPQIPMPWMLTLSVCMGVAERKLLLIIHSTPQQVYTFKVCFWAEILQVCCQFLRSQHMIHRNKSSSLSWNVSHNIYQERSWENNSTTCPNYRISRPRPPPHTLCRPARKRTFMIVRKAADVYNQLFYSDQEVVVCVGGDGLYNVFKFPTRNWN